MSGEEQAPWYARWFEEEAYELVYSHHDDEEARRMVDLIEQAAGLSKGSTVVDVACGRGRHSIELARRGYDVTGADLSENALARAREAAQAAGVAVRWVRGDMREAACDACADAVVNLFTAFGFFDTEADHQRAVDAMAASLRPGGVLVQDFLNAPRVRATLVPHSERVVDGLHVDETRWIARGRVRKRLVIRPVDAPETSARTFEESVALLDRADFERLYARSGLRALDVRGDYDAKPWTPQSPRLILVSRRA